MRPPSILMDAAMTHSFPKALTGVALLLAAAPAELFAQWPPYPTPDVPKTADGKPNLNGPAPRMPDGKPDLSGVWLYQRPPGTPAPEPPPANAPPDRDLIPLAVRRSQFWNLGASFPDGLPFTPWAAELHRQRVEHNSVDNPDAHCLPLGLMQLHTHGQPRKMIQTPGLIVILYEANGGIRQIFTDGRPLPKDPDPWWFGYSAGKWDGDTLVVETTGFRDMGWLDVEGSPLTDAGKLIERFRRPDYGHLEIEVTVVDPKAYTKPWTVTVHQRIMLDTDLIEFVCQENDKDETHLVGK
ncbi:MAG TPA: hypothetical protein VLY24_08995 [Bryobacteraceae bacterium]|nr:hypothetical protein [Bryobacteraceae bacterium]